MAEPKNYPQKASLLPIASVVRTPIQGFGMVGLRQHIIDAGNARNRFGYWCNPRHPNPILFSSLRPSHFRILASVAEQCLAFLPVGARACSKFCCNGCMEFATTLLSQPPGSYTCKGRGHWVQGFCSRSGVAADERYRGPATDKPHCREYLTSLTRCVPCPQKRWKQTLAALHAHPRAIASFLAFYLLNFKLFQPDPCH